MRTLGLFLFITHSCSQVDLCQAIMQNDESSANQFIEQAYAESAGQEFPNDFIFDQLEKLSCVTDIIAEDDVLLTDPPTFEYLVTLQNGAQKRIRVQPHKKGWRVSQIFD